jgi:hypothetical protein
MRARNVSADARRHLGRAGHVKPSAADVLRGVLSPQQETRDDGPSIVELLADHVRNFDAEWAAQKEAEAEAERIKSLTPAQRFVENVAGSAPSGAGASGPSTYGATAPAGQAPHIPLNGAQVLAAALRGLGVNGTVNGGTA